MDAKDFIAINQEYFQNIIAISSALLLLVPTFLEKVISTRRCKFMAYLAITGFLLAVLSSLAAQVGLSYIASGVYSQIQTNIAVGTGIARISQWIVWISFVVGIISLAVFVLANIFREDSPRGSVCE